MRARRQQNIPHYSARGLTQIWFWLDLAGYTQVIDYCTVAGTNDIRRSSELVSLSDWSGWRGYSGSSHHTDSKRTKTNSDINARQLPSCSTVPAVCGSSIRDRTHGVPTAVSRRRCPVERRSQRRRRQCQRRAPAFQYFWLGPASSRRNYGRHHPLSVHDPNLWKVYLFTFRLIPLESTLSNLRRIFLKSVNEWTSTQNESLVVAHWNRKEVYLYTS